MKEGPTEPETIDRRRGASCKAEQHPLFVPSVCPRLAGSWFKSYSTQECQLSVKAPAIRRTQTPRLTGKNTESGLPETA
jgi:hypothetical protein